MSEESPPFMADSLCLFKSDLTPQGAVYSTLERVRLKGNRGGEPRKKNTI
jgi:2'-5' RNA ligase